ncbi:MAG: hypothetical protein ACI96W_002950 [Paraglaciecola sp.]|jgi:hypothetical protein
MVLYSADWPWSSYLATNWLMANFSQNKPEAIERFKHFVAEGVGELLIWSSPKITKAPMLKMIGLKLYSVTYSASL